jgi:hypothetical protein
MQLTFRRLAAVLTLTLHFGPSSTGAELYTLKTTGETGWFNTDINN